MLNLPRLLLDDCLLRALSDLNRKALEDLKISFAEALSQATIPRRSNKPRGPGAGRKPR